MIGNSVMVLQDSFVCASDELIFIEFLCKMTNYVQLQSIYTILFSSSKM